MTTRKQSRKSPHEPHTNGNGHHKSTGNTSWQELPFGNAEAFGNLYQDAFQTWTDYYQQMSTEGAEYFRKSLESAHHYAPAAMAAQEMTQLWQKQMQEWVAHHSGDSHTPISPVDPDLYRSMYRQWLDSMSRVFESGMRTPQFAEAAGRNLEAMSDAKEKVGELLDAYWHALHLASSEDMREIYHKFYVLERKVDDMDRRIREIHAAVVSNKAKK